MTDAQRQRLFDQMMRGVREQSKGDAMVYRIYEESVLEDVDLIEPLIDQIIEEEIRAAGGK